MAARQFKILFPQIRSCTPTFSGSGDIDIGPYYGFGVLVSARTAWQELVGNLLQDLTAFSQRHTWCRPDRVFYHPWRHCQYISLHDFASHGMNKALIAYKIAVRVGVSITFLCDGGLSIKGEIKKISYLHGTNIIVQVRVIILYGTKD